MALFHIDPARRFIFLAIFHVSSPTCNVRNGMHKSVQSAREGIKIVMTKYTVEQTILRKMRKRKLVHSKRRNKNDVSKA